MKPTKLQASAALAKAVDYHDELRANMLAAPVLKHQSWARVMAALAAYEATPDAPEQAMFHHCNKCGGNWTGESGAIIHPGCKAKATPDEKPGADWMRECAVKIWGQMGGKPAGEIWSHADIEIYLYRHAHAQHAAVSASGPTLDQVKYWLENKTATVPEWTMLDHALATIKTVEQFIAERAAKAQP